MRPEITKVRVLSAIMMMRPFVFPKGLGVLENSASSCLMTFFFPFDLLLTHRQHEDIVMKPILIWYRCFGIGLIDMWRRLNEHYFSEK